MCAVMNTRAKYNCTFNSSNRHRKDLNLLKLNGLGGSFSARIKLLPPDAALTTPVGGGGAHGEVHARLQEQPRAWTPPRAEASGGLPSGAASAYASPRRATAAPRDGRGRGGPRALPGVPRGAGRGAELTRRRGRHRTPGSARPPDVPSRSPRPACCSESAAARRRAACTCEMRPRAAGTRAAATAAAEKAGAASSARGAQCMRASTRALGSCRPRRLHKHLFRTRSPR